MIRVLVVGADDAQTASVVRHLLRGRTFVVRALVRDLANLRVREMERSGIEIVEGDLANRASLRSALRNVNAAFGVCCHADDSDWHERLERNLINACAGSEVEHLVLTDATPALESYARSLDLPVTFLRVIRTDEETLRATCLSGAIAIRAMRDLGGILLPVFSAPSEFVGRTLLVAVTGQSTEPQRDLSHDRIELSSPRLLRPPVGTWNHRRSRRRMNS